ncbi:MAG TPA: hypothetical protein VIX90_15215 [Edaphobacter sp.]
MRFIRSISLGSVLSFTMLGHSQTPTTLQGPTTKVLAIGHIVGTPDDAMRQTMPTEVRDTVSLYLAGKLDQWFARKDVNGVVFLVNAASVDEARAILSKLPLVESKRLEFDLIPLGPLSPLRYLMQESKSDGKP